MPNQARTAASAFEDLERYAKAAHVEIDPSFFTELTNYSGHEEVRELSALDLRTSLVGIGKAAIHKSGEKVGAGAVRLAILELCSDPFSPCVLAARRILRNDPEVRELVADRIPATSGTGE